MFHKILVAIDHSDSHKAVFAATLNIAKKTNAHLMLLHVLSIDEPTDLALTVFSSYYPTVSEDLIKRFQAEQQELENRGLAILRSLADEAITAGVATELTQNTGSPSQLICTLAKDWEADLIVVGRREQSGWRELCLGSVSNYVLHHAPCSVLVIQNPVEVTLETPSANEIAVS